MQDTGYRIQDSRCKIQDARLGLGFMTVLHCFDEVIDFSSQFFISM